MGHRTQMCRKVLAFPAGLLLCLLASVAGETDVGSGGIGDSGEADPCSCALLNFWDPAPRHDATECCQALEKICMENKSSIRCGHVARFCLKRRSGYSAWVLDHFVRDALRPHNCPQFNPDATHDEACGDGWCRTGYGCTTVRAEVCKKESGKKCGKGFCRAGAKCADMSSQVCKQMSEEKLKKRKKNGEVFDDVSCTKGKCSVCETVTEHECVLDEEMTPPCTKAGCGDKLSCGPEEEKVCTIRPEALLYIGNKAPEEHKPEKVPEHLRRFTAFVLPALGCFVGLILFVALVSWGSIRVRRAKKENAQACEEEVYDDEQKHEHHGDITARDGLPDQKLPMPISPCASPAQPSHHGTRFHLPLSAANLNPDNSAPYSGRRSARHSARSSGCFRLWTPRSGYQSMTDVDLDAQALQGGPVDYDGDNDDGYSARGGRRSDRIV